MAFGLTWKNPKKNIGKYISELHAKKTLTNNINMRQYILSIKMANMLTSIYVTEGPHIVVQIFSL